MSMLFCPTCSNLLALEGMDSGAKGKGGMRGRKDMANDGDTYSSIRFYCKTCPYIFNVEQKIYAKMELPKKK